MLISKIQEFHTALLGFLPKHIDPKAIRWGRARKASLCDGGALVVQW